MCDTCLQKHPSGIKHHEFASIQEQMMEQLSSTGLSTDEVLANTEADADKKEKTLAFLLSEEIIHQKDGILFV